MVDDGSMKRIELLKERYKGLECLTALSLEQYIDAHYKAYCNVCKTIKVNAHNKDVWLDIEIKQRVKE